jgi:sugar phosphate isomerase/epimerase
MMNRRIFLHNLAAGFGGAMIFNRRNLAQSSAGRNKLSKIGLQLYTVRKSMQADLPKTLRQVASLGIKEVEFAGYFNNPPGEIKQLLKRLNLAAPSAHVDTATIRGGLPQAIDAAKMIGHRYLVLGYVPAEERRTLDDYKKLAELLDRAGAECRRAGLQLAYHNHDFEFVELAGQTPYDLILAETDALNVKLELDLYWIAKAGFDPLAYFEKYPGRFPLVHVKDMDDSPRRSFTEVGRGVVDFGKIFARAGAAGIRHYFIEQDETPADPLESVRISLDYLQKLKF